MTIEPKPESDSKPIKFGVMCSGTTFATWEAKCIEKLLEIESVELSLLIIDEEALVPQSFFSKFKRFKNFKTILWNVYRILACRRVKAAKPVSLENRLQGVASIICKTTKKGKFSQYFLAEDIETISDHRLEFILRFGFNIIRGEILNVAQFGVWSFHHDDEQKYRGAPPGFWEIYHDDPVTGALLQRINDRLDGGIVLRKGFFRTKTHSCRLNLDLILSESTHWPYQACLDIKNGYTEYMSAAPSTTAAPIYSSPTNTQFLYYYGKIIRNLFSKIIERFLTEYIWSIGIIEQPVHDFLKNGDYPAPQWLPEVSADTYSADPFLYQPAANESLNIIFECFEHQFAKGKISSVKWNKGNFKDKKTVLSPDYHLSYPFIFQNNDDWYCIPESGETRSVQLFKFVKENHWAKEKTLIENFPGVDASVIFYQDIWWMFMTHADDGTEHKLYIWYAEDLKSDWRAHEQNPVKFDIQSSRPAGPPFIYENELYRPAQNCSTTYGGSLMINKVSHLTPTEFSETSVKSLNPKEDSKYPDGLHTISSLGNTTVIDGKRKVFIPFVPALLKAKIHNKFKKLF